MVDAEIAQLLLQELETQGALLAAGSAPEAQRRALHTLKGSAALAGERALSEAISRVERRLAARDPQALDDARALVAQARAALLAGGSFEAPAWPEPPADLAPVAIDPATAPIYTTEMHDRLERIDRALAAAGDDRQAAAAAFREVHAMKGGALAVGDEVTAWFCHGLEELLRAGERSEEDARRALDQLDRWRGLLAELIVAPDRALETLRARTRTGRRASAPPPRAAEPAPPEPAPSTAQPGAVPLASPPAAAQPSALPPTLASTTTQTGALPPTLAPTTARTGAPEILVGRDAPFAGPSIPPAPPSEAEPRSAADGATLRVATATLDRLVERVRQLGQARLGVAERADTAQGVASRARHLRSDLADALRLIGPPRPWGAPAAAIARIKAAAHEVGVLSDELDRASVALREIAEEVRAEATAAHGEIVAARTTKVGWLFDRVAAAVNAQARREHREVRLQITGHETPIDRRVAEMLFDPLLQLARNAVTHGIEPPQDRVLRGKPAAGTVHLSAEPRSGGLRIRVLDDGAGVDIPGLRSRALADGTITPEMARAADDQTLLALLFVPGFTLRETADLLAGRGVGLDVTLEAVRRLGGTIRLVSRPGMGLTATLDIPFERGLVKVLWVEAAGATFGIPVQHVRRVVLARDETARPFVPLADCLRGPPAAVRTPAPEAGPSRFAIELDPRRRGEAPAWIGVDHVGTMEDVALRGISPLVSTAGPYAGAIVRGDALRLCLDAHVLVELVATGGAHG